MREFDLPRKLKDLKKSLHRDIMTTAKVEAEKHFKKSFDNEGFNDKGVKKWKAIKKASGGKILTKTRALGDSLKATVNGDKVKITSPLPYAQVHNEGGRAGRGGSAKIPKRQFIGKSDALNRILDKQITRIINKKLKR